MKNCANADGKGDDEAKELQMQQTPMPTTLPRLNDNIIYLAIEKMFFTVGREGCRRREMDLRAPDNAYTRFMFLNRVHFNAMLAQFAKMDYIRIIGEKEERKSVRFHRNPDHISTYNDGEQGGVFSGPYFVTDHFVFRLIHYGKLRTSCVRTDGCLTNREPIKTSLEGKKKKKLLEIFSALFLNKVIEVPGDYDLEIKGLELREELGAIKRNFEAILALNSDEICLRSYTLPDHVNMELFFDCKADQSGKLTTYRTKKIFFYQNLSTHNPKEEFALFAQTWTALILHLAKVCPNLSQLDCDVNADFIVAVFDDILDGMLQLVETVQGMLISELADGSPQLKTRLKLRLQLTYCPRLPLKNQSHELFQLGTALTLKNIGTRRYTARAIKMADKLGREHEFVFKILGYQCPIDSDSSDEWL